MLELLCNTNRQLLPKQNQLVRSHVFLNKPLLCCYHRCPAAHLVCLTSKQRLAEHWVQRELSHAAAKLGELSTVVQRAQRIQLLMTGSARGGVGNSGRVVVAVVVGARLSGSKDAMANMSRGAHVGVCVANTGCLLHTSGAGDQDREFDTGGGECIEYKKKMKVKLK